jgi:hypothetical protein
MTLPPRDPDETKELHDSKRKTKEHLTQLQKKAAKEARMITLLSDDNPVERSKTGKSKKNLLLITRQKDP